MAKLCALTMYFSILRKVECTEDDLRILFAKFVSTFAEGVRVCVYVRMCVCLCKDGLPSYKMHVVYFICTVLYTYCI